MHNNSSLSTDARRHSLSGQLLLWLMICLFIILSISAITSYRRAYFFANLAYDRAIFRVALSLADQVDVIDNRVVIDLPEIAKNLIEYDKDDILNYRISAPDGKLVIGESDIKPPRKKILSGDHLYYDDIFNGEKVRVVAYALPIINSSLKGDLLIQVAETRTKRVIMVREIIEEMILPQLLIMLVTAFVIYYSIKHSLSPLNQLKAALAKRSHNDLSPISTNHTPTEITPLINEMNGLMLRVKDGVDLQNAFVADASHQLRTPITVLQNQVELALREQVAASTKHSLENIALSTQHLARLVQQLLILARVEPLTKNHDRFEPIDLKRLAKEVTAEWVPHALEKNIDLGFECPKQSIITIHGNSFMLKEMLVNLIDNSICYTPEGGEVTVRLLLEQQYIILQVIDNGIGIAPDKREIVFNRFYRVEDNVGNGCGLGLAIVKEIALTHQAEISIQDGITHKNGSGAGTNIRIKFQTIS